MDFNSTIYETLHSYGANSYLISQENLDAFLRYMAFAQAKANRCYNVTVKPYKGRKYNPALVWVCVG